MQDKIKVTRDKTLVNKVVFVDGQAGCGKTMITSIISSFNRVEIFNYAPEIENICILENYNKITKDAAETMIKIQSDLCLYETMMSRRVNFRYKDLSSVFSNVFFLKYFKRLFQEGDEAIPNKLKLEKPILNYAVHNLLSFSDPIFRALSNKLFFIEVVRHPLYMIIQNTINHNNSNKKNGLLRRFRVHIKGKKNQYPYQFYKKENLFNKLNSCERAIYDIDFFTNRTENFKKKLSVKNSNKILTIPFEQFVLNPNNTIKSILLSLNTTTSSKTKKLLAKHKIPRTKISDGIALDVYKRFGWKPPLRGFSEKDELNKRRDFVIKQKISKKYLNILDKLSEEYEKKYLKKINLK